MALPQQPACREPPPRSGRFSSLNDGLIGELCSVCVFRARLGAETFQFGTLAGTLGAGVLKFYFLLRISARGKLRGKASHQNVFSTRNPSLTSAALPRTADSMVVWASNPVPTLRARPDTWLPGFATCQQLTELRHAQPLTRWAPPVARARRHCCDAQKRPQQSGAAQLASKALEQAVNSITKILSDHERKQNQRRLEGGGQGVAAGAEATVVEGRQVGCSASASGERVVQVRRVRIELLDRRNLPFSPRGRSPALLLPPRTLRQRPVLLTT